MAAQRHVGTRNWPCERVCCSEVVGVIRTSFFVRHASARLMTINVQRSNDFLTQQQTLSRYDEHNSAADDDTTTWLSDVNDTQRTIDIPTTFQQLQYDVTIIKFSFQRQQYNALRLSCRFFSRRNITRWRYNINDISTFSKLFGSIRNVTLYDVRCTTRRNFRCSFFFSMTIRWR